MRLGTCEENGVEGIFYLSLLEEMVFAMHVLAEPAHHLARAQWAAGAAHAAGFLDRRRRGGYVDYCLRAEEVDFLTYRIFEYLL
jgi:hypothetical protein